jgi:hypothetical protein
MTELFIDNRPVALPDKFSWKITEENPFFTKSGKFTLDVELSLTNPQNAAIYKHLNRINNKIAVPLDRPARLVVDNDVILNGTEIISQITDRKVKIQLVSGESELNYFIGGDKKINEMVLGNLYENNVSSFDIPVYSTNKDECFNTPPIHVPEDSDIPSFLTPGYVMPQPCFYKVINLMLNALGYTVKENVLETGDFQYLYLLNGNQQDDDISKSLPDWTVDEFFSEIEKMFNIGFFVNKQDKTVSILFKKDFYQDAPKTFITQIQDPFTKNIDNEKREDYSIANIGYDLPSDEYFDFQNIDPLIYDNARKMEFLYFSDIVDYFNTINKADLKNRIFKATVSKTQYICYEEETETGAVYSLKKVNIFSPLFNNPNSSEIDIELKITPAPMRVIDLPVKRAFIYEPIYYLRTQMPAVETVGYVEEEALDIQAEIEGTSEKEKYSVDSIQLYFYKGTKTIYEKGALPNSSANRKLLFPVAFVDCIWEFNSLAEIFIDNSASLRLNDDNRGLKSLYQSSINIDTTNEYTFYFIHKGTIDAKSIFVINNKEFVCKEINRQINVKGFDKIIEGTFYAVNH